MDPSTKPPKSSLSALQEETIEHAVSQNVGDTNTPQLSFPGPASEPRQENATSLVGQTFGDFEVLSELGRGGMGVVYKARQIKLNRVIALKILHVHDLTKPIHRTRFLLEARACAMLSHPNILAVYDAGECPAGLYCAMEYIDGQTLNTIIEGKTVPIPFGVGLLFRIAEAVHYAHTKGIVHRDLKPSNIMLDRNRRPIVMDFGLAKLLEDPNALTQEGDIIGTPTYMPPEQARGNVAKIGPHTDIYSLGAILYRLLAGQPPYGASSPLDTLLKLDSEEPPPSPRDFRPEIPPKLEQICMKCLQKDPAKRFPTAHALASELRRVRGSSPKSQLGPETTRHVKVQGTLEMQWTKGQIPLVGESLTIGRNSECDVELPAQSVSDRHCRIHINEKFGTVSVEDLGSTNGTKVNDRLINLASLHDGDLLNIGGCIFVVRLAKGKK